MVHMYFIGLVAPGEINREVFKWKAFMQDKFGCTAALRSPAHITLIPPFWMDQELEESLLQLLEKFARQQEPLGITLRDFGAFKPRVIYINALPNQPLDMLQARLQQTILNANTFPLKIEDRPFHPHVTIATRDLHKKAFYESWEIFKEKNFDAMWMVNEISLLRHNQKKWDVVYTSRFSK